MENFTLGSSSFEIKSYRLKCDLVYFRCTIDDPETETSVRFEFRLLAPISESEFTSNYAQGFYSKNLCTETGLTFVNFALMEL